MAASTSSSIERSLIESAIITNHNNGIFFRAKGNDTTTGITPRGSAKLRETPLGAEIFGKHTFHESEAGLGIINVIPRRFVLVCYDALALFSTQCE
jgi:hypothetical protein